MRCLVRAGAFRRRLAAVAAVLPRRAARPILGTVRLEIDDEGRGQFHATDGESWARIEAPLLRVERRGAVLLPRQLLRTALSRAGDAELWLDADPDAFFLVGGPNDPPHRLEIAGPDGQFDCRTYRPEEHPTRVEGGGPGHHELGLGALRRLIRATLIAASTDDHPRYALGGCLFGLGPGSIDLVATDGRRLAHARSFDVRTLGEPRAPRVFAPGDRTRPLAAVVGARPLRVLDGLLGELKDPSLPAELEWAEDGYLQLRAPGLWFATRQLAGTFPAWEDVFPPPSPHRANCGRGDRLLAVLKQGRTLIGRDVPTLRVELRPRVLRLSFGDPREGGFAFEMNREADSGVIQADFDPEHLLDALGALGGEEVDIELNAPGLPAVLSAPGQRHAVMPLSQGSEPGALVVERPAAEGDPASAA